MSHNTAIIYPKQNSVKTYVLTLFLKINTRGAS